MSLSHISYLCQMIVQRLTLALLLCLGAAGLLWTLAASAGLCAWLQLQVGLGGPSPVDAEIAVQLILTALVVGLCFFLRRTIMLRNFESHRNFRVTMGDVAQAYQAAHVADRDGVFELRASWRDSVRERIRYLRRHPDCQRLKPQESWKWRPQDRPRKP